MSRHTTPASWDTKALEIARRFTDDADCQQRAQLQVAVLEAMRWVAPDAPQLSAQPWTWHLTFADGSTDYWDVDPATCNLDPRFEDVPWRVVPLYAIAAAKEST